MFRRLVPKLALAALAVLGVAWLVFSWFEAKKEIRVLCSMFHPGLEREDVVRTLETGSYLRYRTGTSDGPDEDSPIFADGFFGLGSRRCVIEFEDGRVVSSGYE